MPEPTPAMKRKMAQLEKRAEAAAEGAEPSSAETVSLSVMLGDGSGVVIGGKTYTVAAFPVSKLALAGKLIAQCPDLMVSAAMSAAEDGTVSAQGTADTLNRLMQKVKPGEDALSADLMEFAFSTMAMAVTEQEAAAMTPLTVLALSRKHPGITEADIECDLDTAAFLAVLCRIFAENQALRQRF